MVSLARRCLLVQAALAGCAQTEAPPRLPDALLQPWRQWPGGFLSPAVPGAGGLPLAGSGMYVRFGRAAAVALRGSDLLLADLPAGRLWRCDTGFNTLTGVAGAPVSPGMALALGPDQSAWLLDPGARQVLRFARDGRLLRSLSLPIGLPSPVGLALADAAAPPHWWPTAWGPAGPSCAAASRSRCCPHALMGPACRGWMHWR